jgi:hypothetical protein
MPNLPTPRNQLFARPGAAFIAGVAVAAAAILFFLGNESTPVWLVMLFDGGGVACLLVAAIAGGIWLAGVRGVKLLANALPNSLCLTPSQFDEIEIHYLDNKGRWQFNTFREKSRGAELLQAQYPGAWARFERRYSQLHTDDARMLARFETKAIRALSEIEMRHGEMIADLNRDVVHSTLDECANALRRLREAKESAQRHKGGGGAPKDLTSSQQDSRALERARRMPALLADLEVRMKRSKSGEAIDKSGLILFANEHQEASEPA